MGEKNMWISFYSAANFKREVARNDSPMSCAFAAYLHAIDTAALEAIKNMSATDKKQRDFMFKEYKTKKQLAQKLFAEKKYSPELWIAKANREVFHFAETRSYSLTQTP